MNRLGIGGIAGLCAGMGRVRLGAVMLSGITEHFNIVISSTHFAGEALEREAKRAATTGTRSRVSRASVSLASILVRTLSMLRQSISDVLVRRSPSAVHEVVFVNGFILACPLDM